MIVLAAKIWHYWIAVPLTVVFVLGFFVTLIGYLQKVVRPKYPSNKQR